MAKKILELAERTDQHTQLIIGLARHQIAFHHFGEVRDRSLEVGIITANRSAYIRSVITANRSADRAAVITTDRTAYI